jgi:hypothetical protein
MWRWLRRLFTRNKLVSVEKLRSYRNTSRMVNAYIVEVEKGTWHFHPAYVENVGEDGVARIHIRPGGADDTRRDTGPFSGRRDVERAR